MKTHYLFHSGFLVETSTAYLIFDYYKGDLPEMENDKPVIVFASHKHQDHYNYDIFDILKDKGITDVTALLGRGIKENIYPKDFPGIKAMHHEHYELPGQVAVDTLLSTDSGVAFLVSCPEGTVFHAGDLNDWAMPGRDEQFIKQMQGSFRHEIDLIRDRDIDVAFFPLDPRLGEFYDKGLLYFLKTTKTKKVLPMHFWGAPEIIDKFMMEHPEFVNRVEYTPDYQ